MVPPRVKLPRRQRLPTVLLGIGSSVLLGCLGSSVSGPGELSFPVAVTVDEREGSLEVCMSANMLSYDSDWSDGDAYDSRPSCPTCHDVHGSSQLAMVRDGGLIGLEPGMRIAYVDVNLAFPGGGCGPPNMPTDMGVTLDQSTGATHSASEMNLCATCHRGCWPVFERAPANYSAGNVDIGYQTGGAEVWYGDTTVDTSGDYDHIQSTAYATDPDGGALGTADIDDLQVLVERNASGSWQMHVTEVYAEIEDTP